MHATREEVLEAAMRLSDEDRFAIASELLETFPDELPGFAEDDPELLRELDRRWAERGGAVPWSALRDEWPNKNEPSPQ